VLDLHVGQAVGNLGRALQDFPASAQKFLENVQKSHNGQLQEKNGEASDDSQVEGFSEGTVCSVHADYDSTVVKINGKLRFVRLYQPGESFGLPEDQLLKGDGGVLKSMRPHARY
jgi:hypothetical protein